MIKNELIVFDLEWNIGYKPYTFNYYGSEQVLRGEIVQIGAVKINLQGEIIDTFEGRFRPRIFQKLQRHIAKVTGLTQQDLDKGEPIAKGMRNFIAWCGTDAIFAEWGLDDVPVLKQNLFLLNMDESYPSKWVDLQHIFTEQYPRKEGEGLTLESVVTRLNIPIERPFHDAISDTLYTVDICRKLDLAKGLEQYPTFEQKMEQSLCGALENYHDFNIFSGYVNREAYRTESKIQNTPCPICKEILIPDEIWQKRGNNGYYSLCKCPKCHDKLSGAKYGVFTRYKLMRPDGLHWSFARCTEIANAESAAIWDKKRKQTLERMKARAEKLED